MFSRLISHKAAAGAVLVTSIVLAASLVGPAFGAPSPLSVAKKALKTAKKANKTAKKANKTAKSANKRSKSALSSANSANSAANSAHGAADSAGTKASSALSKAGQALGVAQSAAAHSGPGGIGFGTEPTVPNDGTSISDEAVCPTGFLPVGGGVDVYDPNVDAFVTEGIAVTQSSINSTLDGWVGAVQDTDNSSDRVLEVSVQCAKPSSV
ncbi:MAG: hypothetical protein ACJ766_13380, partial [Thermoleophilaceae bacterium]